MTRVHRDIFFASDTYICIIIFSYFQFTSRYQKIYGALSEVGEKFPRGLHASGGGSVRGRVQRHRLSARDKTPLVIAFNAKSRGKNC